MGLCVYVFFFLSDHFTFQKRLSKHAKQTANFMNPLTIAQELMTLSTWQIYTKCMLF